MRLLGKGYGGVKKFCILMNMLLFLVVKLFKKSSNIIIKVIKIIVKKIMLDVVVEIRSV